MCRAMTSWRMPVASSRAATSWVRGRGAGVLERAGVGDEAGVDRGGDRRRRARRRAGRPSRARARPSPGAVTSTRWIPPKPVNDAWWSTATKTSAASAAACRTPSRSIELTSKDTTTGRSPTNSGDDEQVLAGQRAQDARDGERVVAERTRRRRRRAPRARGRQPAPSRARRRPGTRAPAAAPGDREVSAATVVVPSRRRWGRGPAHAEFVLVVLVLVVASRRPRGRPSVEVVGSSSRGFLYGSASPA